MGNRGPEPEAAAAAAVMDTAFLPVPLIVVALLLVVVVVVVAASFVRPKRYDLRGKHVVITGGSQGIGKCVAAQVLRRGADVTLMARKEAVLVEAQAEVQKTMASPEQKVKIQSIDLASDAKRVQGAFDAAVEAMGKPVDVLVNCAGMSVGPRPFPLAVHARSCDTRAVAGTDARSLRGPRRRHLREADARELPRLGPL